MCGKAHWERCNASLAWYAANKFAFQLIEYAKQNGYSTEGIKIRNKEQIIKGGFGKSDAQVIWVDGPEDWAQEFTLYNPSGVWQIAEGERTISFYLE